MEMAVMMVMRVIARSDRVEHPVRRESVGERLRAVCGGYVAVGHDFDRLRCRCWRCLCLVLALRARRHPILRGATIRTRARSRFDPLESLEIAERARPLRTPIHLYFKTPPHLVSYYHGLPIPGFRNCREDSLLLGPALVGAYFGEVRGRKCARGGEGRGEGEVDAVQARRPVEGVRDGREGSEEGNAAGEGEGSANQAKAWGTRRIGHDHEHKLKHEHGHGLEYGTTTADTSTSPSASASSAWRGRGDVRWGMNGQQKPPTEASCRRWTRCDVPIRARAAWDAGLTCRTAEVARTP